MRPRTFNFLPYVVKHGRDADQFEPFVKVSKSGAMQFGTRTLDKLELNKMMFYRLYQDKGKRTIGIIFSEKEKLTGDQENWKVWEPKSYNKKAPTDLKVNISIGSFTSSLDEVILPSKRLPIGKYIDTESGLEYFWVRIPYGNETPGGRRFDKNNEDLR